MLSSHHMALLPLLLGRLGLGGECPANHGFPPACPRPGVDGPERTQCCRDFYLPSCCEERATHVCVKTTYGKHSGTGLRPGPTDAAVYCPRPGEPDNLRGCCYHGAHTKIQCCDASKIVGGVVLGGVFGVAALVGIIMAVICTYKIKTGAWVCVTVRPGKKKLMTRARAERFCAMQGAVAGVLVGTAQVRPAPQNYNNPGVAPTTTAPAASFQYNLQKADQPPSYGQALRETGTQDRRY